MNIWKWFIGLFRRKRDDREWKFYIKEDDGEWIEIKMDEFDAPSIINP